MSSFTLNVQELRNPDSIHQLNVRWFTSIKDIKDILHKTLGVQPRMLDLYYGTNASRLSNHMTLHDFGIERDGHVLRLTINCPSGGFVRGPRGVNNRGAPNFVLTPSRDLELNLDCQNMITEVSSGLKQGTVPIRTDVLDCTGGVYFMRNVSGQKCAVFKPHDEEQGMPNNGKGYDGNGETSLRPNFKPGQGCIREVAAYIMDVDNFTGVPATMMVHAEHQTFLYPSLGGRPSAPFPKLGSLQKFFVSDGTFEDIGSSMMSDFEVQKIALFDMRLLNCDRNASNILVSKKRGFRHYDSPKACDASDLGLAGERTARRDHRSASLSSWESQYSSSDDTWLQENHDDYEDDTFLRLGIASRSSSDNTDPGHTIAENEGNAPDSRKGSTRDRYLLTPIDHGYSLPTALDIKEWDWSWFNLPHIKRPVHPDIKKHLLSIDFEELAANLTSQVAISEDSMFLLRLAHRLLVSGIKAGLTLHDIACLIARLDEDVPSALERAISVAEENAHRAIEMRSSRNSHSGNTSLNSSPKEREASIKPMSKNSTKTTQISISSQESRRSDLSLSSSGESLGAILSSNQTGDDDIGMDPFAQQPLSIDEEEKDQGTGNTGTHKAKKGDLLGLTYGIGVGLSAGKPGSSFGGGSLMRLESMKADYAPRPTLATAPTAHTGSAQAAVNANTKEYDTPKTPTGKMNTQLLPPSWLPKSPVGTVTSISIPFPTEISSGGVMAPSTASPKSGTSRTRPHTIYTDHGPPWKTCVGSSTAQSLSMQKSMQNEGFSTSPSMNRSGEERKMSPADSKRNSPKKKSSPPLDPFGSQLCNDGRVHATLRRFGSHDQLKVGLEDDFGSVDRVSPASSPTKELSFPNTPCSAATDTLENSTSAVSTAAITPINQASKFSKLAKSGTRRLKSPTQKNRKNKKSAECNNSADFLFHRDSDDEDIDTDNEDVSPNDEEVSLSKPSNLVRVTSFTAFANPPLYDVETSERRFGKLFREKRRLQLSTSEFKILRQHFADDRVEILVGKIEKLNK